MLTQLQGKVALVTGASKGIGAGIARAMAAAGADVVVNFAHDRVSADVVVDDITALGRRAIAVQADITSNTDVARLFSEAHAVSGGLR